MSFYLHLCFSSVGNQYPGVCYTKQTNKQTLNFLNEALSSWCQEETNFFLFLLSHLPLTVKLFALWHLFLPQYWNYLSEVAKDGWINGYTQSILAIAHLCFFCHLYCLLPCSSWNSSIFYVRDLVRADGSTFLFLTLLRGLLSSSHLLALGVCVCFMSLPLFCFPQKIAASPMALT